MRTKANLLIFLIGIPLIILLGVTVFKNSRYIIISLAVAFLACLPFFISFESKMQSSARIIIIAVMSALTVVGRIVFAAVPAFKPVTALVVITAMYFGSEAGFITGALSAIISNLYFGQGAWTPFQMFTWGLIGLIAGLLSKPLKQSKLFLCLYGIFSGVIFSLIMDIFSTVWLDGTFNTKRYLTLIVSAIPFTVIYAVSNVIFLLFLAKPIGTKLERVKTKYLQ